MIRRTRRQPNAPRTRRAFEVSPKGAGSYPQGVESYATYLEIEVSNKVVTLNLSGGFHQPGALYSGSQSGTWSETATLGRRNKFSTTSSSSSMNYHGEDLRHSAPKPRPHSDASDDMKNALKKLGGRIFEPFTPVQRRLLHAKIASIGVDIPLPGMAHQPVIRAR